jgi:small-conductance mechanosensitive channel
MTDLFQSLGLSEMFSPQDIRVLLRVLIIIAIAFPVILFLRRSTRQFISRKYSVHYGMVSGKVVWYTGMIILILLILKQFNVDLTPLLGAAGVLGVALGFASQTSVSNIISGLFLIAEKSFEVNDVITVGSTTGMVLSIDTLSVKLRTFDNRYVRIPNEVMIKTEVINISRFPIRRVDLMLGVAYKEDIERVKSILIDVAKKIPVVLNDPSPVFIFQAFGSSSIDLQFSVWALREDWLEAKNQMYQAIKKTFDEENVEIPFPHISIYKGENTDPIPIQLMVTDKADSNLIT